MTQERGYQVLPFSVNRRFAAASASVCRERNTIHTITEVDVTEPRRLIRELGRQAGERPSFTGYVVACLARAIAENPTFNSFRRGNRLYLLDEVIVGVLVEREVDGEPVPEPLPIRAADRKTLAHIHHEIRAAQQKADEPLGALSGVTWVAKLIPSFLIKLFIRLGSRSVTMARRFGVVTVTAVGMFAPSPMWALPLSASTVAVTVGSIVKRATAADGRCEAREHLCLTISFDHDIVDGAPAARFTKRLCGLLAAGDALRDDTWLGSFGKQE